MPQIVRPLAVLALAFSASAASAQSTLDKVKAGGTIGVAYRESSIPFSFLDDKAQPVGFGFEICGRVVDEVKKVTGRPDLKVNLQSVTSANRIPLLVNGTIDIECGSTTNNVARQKDVAFAVTTFVEEVRIAVKADSGITSIGQLVGKTVATTTGTTSVQTLRKHERANGVDFKEVYGKDHADSFLLLESGRADAFVMDGSILAKNIATSKNPAGFKIVGEVLSVEPIAIMLRKDDAAFKAAVDESIKAQIKSGDLAKTYDKWFLQPIPPTNAKIGMPLNDATKAAWATPNDKPMEEYAKR